MKLADLAPDILTADIDLRRADITAVTADSRAVVPGCLFAALQGTKVHGATFVPQAVAAGAAVIRTVVGIHGARSTHPRTAGGSLGA